MLRLEGRGDDRSLTCKCKGTAEYRCRDCAYGTAYCKICMVERHRDLPLHRLQVSNLLQIKASYL
jgi:hypothetical protein